MKSSTPVVVDPSQLFTATIQSESTNKGRLSAVVCANEGLLCLTSCPRYSELIPLAC
jgi:hypothetical protein